MKVAFFRGRGRIVDRLIRWWQVGPYSHCEMVLDGPFPNGTYEVASAIWGEGVRIKRQTLPSSSWDFVEVQADPKTIRAWFIDNEKAKYDYFGLLGFVFRPIRSLGRRFFCSEACGESIGVVDAWRHDPNAFYSLLTYQASQKDKFISGTKTT